MQVTLRNQLYNWIFQLRGPESGAVVLVQRRVFILPTRHGVLFAAVLVLMLVGSVNYNLSLGFVLTFLLGAMGINAMLHTFRNLANLRVSAGRAAPVFAGETARFSVCVENPGGTDRYSIGLTRDRKHSVHVDVPARRSALPAIGVPAPRRGLLRPGRLTLFTRYPLGLYYAWAYLELDMQCVVYPKPAPPGMPLPAPENSAGQGAEHGQGQGDCGGGRGGGGGGAGGSITRETPRATSWKAVAARDQGYAQTVQRAC
ncbi:MAG: hypothetical protein KIT18_08980 [Burkholderiales bacterium]|nr:hypothetical protein [Burkholderiales bacterium]